MIYQTERYKSK